MGTSWVAVSINNITTRASREMNINIFDFNWVNVAKHWHVAGEVFAISDGLVKYVSSNVYSDNNHNQPQSMLNIFLTFFSSYTF